MRDLQYSRKYCTDKKRRFSVLGEHVLLDRKQATFLTYILKFYVLILYALVSGLGDQGMTPPN
jgi:hypothetical protein